MKTRIEITLPPEEINNTELIKSKILSQLSLSDDTDLFLSLIRRSVDSRNKRTVFRLLYEVGIGESLEPLYSPVNYSRVSENKKVIIVGFGPAGMFAALKLIEVGIKPIILERGKDVSQRRRDLKAIQQFDKVNPDSNYCFGEGGAGTYSDGKLYTRSNKRGDVKKILSILIQHGADSNIMVDAHPHIGSNKLPDIIKTIHERIINSGGEIFFRSRVTDFIIQNDKISGAVVNDHKEYFADAVVLSTGHSARDIYYLLAKKNIFIEKKLFAVGVRVEHPQALINEIQYHSKMKSEALPPATYSLACQANDRGVFSFCMCPGGWIIPASTAQNELVLNGMSLSRRDSPLANSGLVVQVTEEDLLPYSGHGVFAGIEFQKDIEHKCAALGEKTQTAPAQRITDFLQCKLSGSLPKTSYIPGVVSASLDDFLPDAITAGLRASLKVFNNKMHGYLSEEAVMLAPETRTSSPVRIPREKDTFMHPQIEGLFPAGEGAGYAGGIVSAAIDGDNAAAKIAEYLKVLD
ncbi:MAG: NAD(P)/FAD-dependent oxidoreductase [Ignavibacteriaceae bacterium]